MTDFGFPREFRLRRQFDFDRVHHANLFAADEFLVMKGIANDLDYTRLGVSISRRVGNAVVRNRWKRYVREAFRTSRTQLPVGLDLVVRPRRDAAPDLESIRTSLLQLARRLARRLAKEPQ